MLNFIKCVVTFLLLIKTMSDRYSREIKLAFRTRLPRSLLAYHGVKERPEGLPPYALYVLVEKGQLKVKHVIGDNSTVVIVGKGIK
jgi:hypothetical protein